MYGPYISMGKGEYQLSITAEYGENATKPVLTITADNGQKELNTFELEGGENKLQFHLYKNYHRVEFVVINDKHEQIALNGGVLTKIE